MSNIIICRAHEVSSFAAQSSEVTGLESDNLGNVYPSKAWRTTGDSAEYVEIDFGAAVEVDTIALLFTNLTSAATWRIRAAADQASLSDATEDYDSGSVTAWAGATENVDQPHALLHLSSAETHRWWRIDLADAANPDGYIEAGRVFFSSAFQPTRNIGYGGGRGFIDLSEKERFYNGAPAFTEKAKLPVFSGVLPWLTDAEREANMLELQRLAGATEPLLVVTNPEANTYRMGRMYYGTMELAPVINTSFGVNEARLTVEGWV